MACLTEVANLYSIVTFRNKSTNIFYYITITTIIWKSEKFNQVGLEEIYKTYLDTVKCPAFYKHALSMISVFGNM